MREIDDLLAKQAEWQRSLSALTWAEKVRMAERVLPDVRLLRQRGAPAPRLAAEDISCDHPDEVTDTGFPRSRE